MRESVRLPQHGHKNGIQVDRSRLGIKEFESGSAPLTPRGVKRGVQGDQLLRPGYLFAGGGAVLPDHRTRCQLP